MHLIMLILSIILMNIGNAIAIENSTYTVEELSLKIEELQTDLANLYGVVEEFKEDKLDKENKLLTIDRTYELVSTSLKSQGIPFQIDPELNEQQILSMENILISCLSHFKVNNPQRHLDFRGVHFVQANDESLRGKGIYIIGRNPFEVRRAVAPYFSLILSERSTIQSCYNALISID